MRLKSVTILLLLIAASGYGLNLKKAYNNVGQGNRIVGGENAEEGFAPYQILLQDMNNSSLCGGAIIDEKWILTASRCVDKNVNEIVVITGTTNYKIPGAVFSIDKVYKHCKWNDPMLANDIALIRLKSPIQFNDRTQPIALPTQLLNEGADVTLAGWGSLELWGKTADALQKINMTYVSYEECLKITFHTEYLHVGNICAVPPKGKRVCHGDSGGPLVNNGHIVGIVNWGNPCANDSPDVYANVYYYLDWIHEVMNGTSKCHQISESIGEIRLFYKTLACF